MKKIILAVLVASFFISSCGENEENKKETISDSVLSGKVNGDAFEARGGKAFMYNETNVSVNVSNSSDDNCNVYVTDFEYNVSFNVPFKEGVYDKVNVVLQKKKQVPMNIFQSMVIIDKITENQIKGRVKAAAYNKDEYSVEGKFTVPFCSK